MSDNNGLAERLDAIYMEAVDENYATTGGSRASALPWQTCGAHYAGLLAVMGEVQRAAAVERGVRETTAGPSQSELDAWRKRATEAETEAAEYQRILREAHEAALTSPAVNRNNLDDPRLTTLRNLATQFASVRESVWMGVTGAARSGLRAEDNRCPHCDCDESKLVHVNDEPHRRCAMCGEEWQTSDQKAFSKRTKLAIRRDGDGT